MSSKLNDTFLQRLRAVFLPADWPWLVAALRQDPQIWEAWQQPALGDNVIAQVESPALEPAVRSQLLSPSSLALLALGIRPPDPVQMSEMLNRMQSDLNFLPSVSLRRKATRAYELLGPDANPEPAAETSSSGNPYPPLAQSGLLALALRERRRLLGSWDGLLDELQSRYRPPEQGLRAAWGAALACLWGLVPDREALVEAISANGASRAAIELALHSLLCNPLSQPDQIAPMLQLLDPLPVEKQALALQILSDQRPSLAAELAARRLAASPLDLTHQCVSTALLSPHLAQVTHAWVLADVLQTAGNRLEALTAYEQARSASRLLQAENTYRLAQALLAQGDLERARPLLEEAVALDNASPAYRTRLARALLDAGQPEDAHRWLPTSESSAPLPDLGQFHPTVGMVRARLENQAGSQSTAGQTAVTVLQNIEASPDGPSDPSLVVELAGMLLEFGQPAEAVRAARLALASRPNDVTALSLLSRALEQVGLPEGAVETLSAAIALAPGQAGLRRRCAGLFESLGVWPLALIERQAVIDNDQEQAGIAPADDWYALAHCALKAGETQLAVGAARQAVALETDEQKTAPYHLLLGQACTTLGDMLGGRQHYMQVTQISPHLPAPWLALAKLDQSTGQASQAVETLRAAAQANPDSPEIYLALGEAYLEDWEGRGTPAPTQALATLQHAAALLEDVPGQLGNRVHLRLGQALYLLGHLDEARQAVEPVYTAHPQDPETAQVYAQVLLALNEPAAALPALRTVVNRQPAALDPYLDYGRALVDTGAQPGEALQALRHVLEIEPAHNEAQALMAEALSASGDREAAFEAYQKVLDTPLASQQPWATRLALGMGKTSLAIGQVENAVAALQEAARLDPQNLPVLRTLVEAYQAAGQVQEAIQTARTVLGQAPEDLETLDWFAAWAVTWALDAHDLDGRSAAQLLSEARQSLLRAVQISPQQVDLHLRLGNLQLHLHNPAGALDSFHQAARCELAGIEDLRQAANQLLELDDPGGAVVALERAINHLQANAEDLARAGSYPLKEINLTLSEAYRQAGQPEAALTAVERSLALCPTESTLYSLKSSLLAQLHRLPEALACLDQALTLKILPAEAAHLHAQAVEILQAQGNLPGALEHAEQMLVLVPGQLSAQTQAAQMAWSLLQPSLARTLLGTPPAEIEADKTLAQYFCLRAELALEAGDELEADWALNAADKAGASQDAFLLARVQASRARLITRKGDEVQAYRLLQEALRQAAASKRRSHEDRLAQEAAREMALLRAAGEAALELELWDNSLELFNQAAAQAPHEPLAQLQLIRALVLRAEASDLLTCVNVLSHNPGTSAVSPQAHQAFEQALEAIHQGKPGTGAAPVIMRWHSRGQAIFEPAPQTAQALVEVAKASTHPEDTAAAIGALRLAFQNIEQKNGTIRFLPLAIQLAKTFPQHPAVLVQLALLLSHYEDYLCDGLTAARQATTQPGLSNRREGIGQALLARLAALAGDLPEAILAVQKALNCCPDEPRWHALAAQIYSESGVPAQAVEHLESAVSLEPQHSPHLIALGQAYLALALSNHETDLLNLQRAIDTLDKATHLAPHQVEAWLALAKALHSGGPRLGQEERAASCAERAVSLAKDQPAPLITRAAISLSAGNYNQAFADGREALRLQETGPLAQEAILIMARSLTRLERPADALSTIEKAIPLTREPLPLLLERARLMAQLQGPKNALVALQDLAKTYPDDARVMSHLARTLVELEQKEGAIVYAQRALREGGSPLAGKVPLEAGEQAELHFLLGQMQREVGQLDQSIHHLNEAIRLNHTLIEAYLELGQAYLERRQTNPAIDTYKLAMRVNPRDYRPYYQAGLAFKESRDYENAKSMLTKAAEYAPTDVVIHRQLAAVVALAIVHDPRRSPTEA